MKIMVAGIGTVGGALVKWLENNTYHEVLKYDPPRGLNDSFEDVDCTFVCVPVPNKVHNVFQPDTSKNIQDTYILEDIVGKTQINDGPVFVRSTVLPGTCDRLSQVSEKEVYFMPEFLTARQADDDMKKLPVFVGVNNPESNAAHIAWNAFNKDFVVKDVHWFTNKELEWAKYYHNVIGAINVYASNLFSMKATHLDISYDKIRCVAAHTGYLPKKWTHVPGPDGKYGFGGTCFPKDLEAFAYFTGLTFLHNIYTHNKAIRGE